MIALSVSAPPGTLACAVSFTLVDTLDPRQVFVDTQEIVVNPPRAACEETTNPHGQTIPSAGSTTLPGPQGGQNEDGYYLISASDASASVFVVDTGTGMTFGPFPSGTKIKYTEAPGTTPTSKPIGSTSGQAGAVLVHITGQGDAAVFAIDAGGTQSPLVFCLVPPLPK